MPLRGGRLRMTTSPRVTLGSWKKLWLVVCNGPCIFCGPRTAAFYELRPAKFPSLPVIILAIVVLVIVVLAVVIGVIPIPVVIAFGPFLFFVPFVEFVQDKACADG